MRGGKVRKPYLIRTPEFQIQSGGIRVMYGLYGHLLAKGQIAYLNAQIGMPSVGIYPEIYHGNDMNAQRVVRYILQKPGAMATGGIPGPSKQEIDMTTDDIYVFSRVYDEWGVNEDHVLFLPILDLLLFRDKKKKRTKTAYYCARGENLNEHPKDAVEITREFAQDQQALADLLNECQALYVYDKITAMLEVARLCGCPVAYFGEDSLETLEKYEPGMNGLGYRNIGNLDVEAFRTGYRELQWTFGNRLDKFIENTQK